MSRPGLRLRGLLIVPVIVVAAACSSGSATPSPGASTPAAGDSASPAAGGSTPEAVESIPPISIPAVSPAASAGQGSGPDAETVVTTEMAASIIGGSPTKAPFGGQLPGGYGSVVAYMTDAGDTVTVFVETIPGLSGMSLKAAMAMAGQQGDLQSVDGLGDFAGKQVQADQVTYAFVQGETLVIIDAQSSSMAGTDLDPKVQAVAQQAAGQL